MKNTLALLACLASTFGILPVCAQQIAHKPSVQAPPPKSNHKSQPAYSNPGERVFTQNCSRCHDAPQSFSPRISATVRP